VTTRGGARAVLDHETGEVMHPVVGPLVESLRLYVEPSRLAARLAVPSPEALTLLDVGLGAGSNALAAWRVSEALPPEARRLSIVSFDRTLDALALALDHPADFALEGAAGDAARALLAKGAHETRRTTWRFVGGELPGALSEQARESVDLVYWDPFSPRANPSLWTLAAFTALRRTCREGCSVHTYSGATASRSALLLAGFSVGLGEPIGEEKQSTQAAVRVTDLTTPLDARWLARLGRSSAPFPADAPTDALERISRCPQFAPRA
jgi:queuine tRNA-ribosyltransferase